jgi:hypothetical protein
VRLGQILRLVAGVLLIPACVAAAICFADMAARGVEGWAALAVFLGAGAYVVIFLFFHDSIERTFFGREPVRRLWGTITGYYGPTHRTSRDDERVDGAGRTVPLYVILVPYTIPLYTVLGMVIVWLVNYLVGMRASTYSVVQGFVLGLTYTFHLFMLGYDIRRKHPDLKVAGYLFTMVVVFLVNVEILAAVSMLAFDGADWIEFNRNMLAETRYYYGWFWDLVSRPFR